MSGASPAAIWAERAITPAGSAERVRVRIAAGRIASVEAGVQPAPGDSVYPAATLVPGLVDLQVNGADGVSFADADRSARERALRWHRQRGTTTLLATLISDSPAALEAGLTRLAGDVARDPGLAGIHLEGPFLAKAKAGAHPQEHLRDPSPALLDRFLAASGGALRMITLAPEREGALAAIARLRGAGVVCAAGHTRASFACMREAADRGLALVTHLGNASDWPTRVFDPEVGYRRSEPGVIGAFLSDPRLRASLILDGHHLHPGLVHALCAARGAGALILVSDAAPFAGLGPGTHALWGMRARIDPRGFATAGEGLAGSLISLSDALRVAVTQAGIPLVDAVAMASAAPAELIGLGHRKGRIAVGWDADLLVLDASLHPASVCCGGIPLA